MHILHIRFRDSNNHYSSTINQFFYKEYEGGGIPNKIVSYEYWFDNNYGGKVYQTVTAQNTLQLISNLDASALSTGTHIFHIRLKDAGGTWSSVTSQFIQKVSGGTGITNQINAYEYWFDNNYAGRVYQSVSAQSEIQLIASINALALENGFHIFHIRFKDAGNSWGNVNSSFFEKFEKNASFANLISEYRYWFDMADSVMVDVHPPSPVNIYQLNTPLNLLGFKKGSHEMHIQFMDTLKNWSSIITDSIYRFPVVVANCTPDNWLLCDSGLVNFTNISLDADTFKWIFDDATSSNLVNPMHFFNTAGTHPVTLIAYDTLDGVTDTLLIDISVASSPVVHLGNDTTICPPELLLNAWNSNCTYLWSNSSTDSLTHINSPGTYSVIVTNQWGCISKDTISVLFNPAATIDLGNDTTICVGNSVVLDAGSGFAYYNWCSGETTQTITATANGIYCVEVTNSYGCHKTDSIHVLIDPCTGIKDMNGNDLVSIYPNPNNGIYYIKALTDFSEPIDIKVTDLSGRLLFNTENIMMTKDNTLTIDNESYESGIYMLYLTSQSARIIKKIIINH
jgi:PKD repeat protein